MVNDARTFEGWGIDREFGPAQKLDNKAAW